MAGKTLFAKGELPLIATAAFLVFTRVFGMSIVLPDFVGYGESLTSNAVLVGTAFGAYGLTLAVMQLPMGLLSDRFGRRRVLLGGTALFVLGSAGAALAPSIGTLIAARLVQGLGAISSTAMALVGESVPEERRTTAMAIVGIPAGMGFFLGMMVGPVLSPSIGVPGLFWVTAGMGLLALLPLAFIRVPAPVVTDSVGDRRSLGLPVLSLAFGGFTLNYALMTALYFLDEGGHTGWRFLLPVLGVALLVMGGLSRSIDRAGLTWQPVAAGALLLAVGASLAGLSVTSWELYVGGLVFFATHATLSAVLPSQVSRIAGRSGGRGHGIQNTVAYIGTFAAGPVAGAFADRPALAFTVLGLVAVVTAGLVSVGLRAAPAGPPAAEAA